MPQPLQREATPPPRGPTWATGLFWLRGPAKRVAAEDEKKVVDILLLNKFFEIICFFGKNCENPFVGGHDRFEGKRALGDKNQYNLFCRK